MVQIHAADNRTQAGLDHVAHRFAKVLDAIHRAFNTADFDKSNRISQDYCIVTGNDFLLGDIQNDVFGGDFVGNTAENRVDDM